MCAAVYLYSKLEGGGMTTNYLRGLKNWLYIAHDNIRNPMNIEKRRMVLATVARNQDPSHHKLL